jgi:hypothetical protein
MREFTIKRSLWDRGERFKEERKERDRVPNPALKHVQDGKMCCLGFYLEACGVPVENLKGHPDPKAVLENNNIELPQEAQWLVFLDHPDLDESEMEGHQCMTVWWDNSGPCQELMEANDDEVIAEDTREARVQRLFAEHAIVRFED